MTDANRQDDRTDYFAFLAEYGFTEAGVQRIVQNRLDQVPMPPGHDSVALAPSRLHGTGLFATRAIGEGEWLAPARLQGMRTPAGRYTNHARHPNCIFVPVHGGDLWLVAAADVPKGTELTVDYRQAGRVNGNHRQKVG